ncbi:MAG: hypothetical protein KatS3mg077_2934 [Candidatus Binatia bacterium]|nr:MAG: hypothetical protein KatS3mg077_2934 [Candidatus Binatia bacterium]
MKPDTVRISALALLYVFATSGCVLLSSQPDYPITSRRREVLEQRHRLEPEEETSTEPEQLRAGAVEEEPLAATLPATESPASAGEKTMTAVEERHPPEETTATIAQSGPPAESSSKAAPDLASTATQDSVAELIGADTPPHVAAALRCVEQGRKLLDRGQLASARDWFERALSLDGNNPYAYYFLAATALREGRLDQAEAFLARAHTLSHQVPVSWQSRFWVLRGSVWEAVGRFGDARQAYREASSLDPSNPQALQGLARLSAPQ